LQPLFLNGWIFQVEIALNNSKPEKKKREKKERKKGEEKRKEKKQILSLLFFFDVVLFRGEIFTLNMLNYPVMRRKYYMVGKILCILNFLVLTVNMGGG
jgi:hypothetical protein